MHVWLVNPYGPIPGEGWRDYRFTLVGRALASRGHRVTWFTSSFAHHTKQYRSLGWDSRVVEPRFTIELVPTSSYSRNVGLRRLLFELSFYRRLCRRATTFDAPDLIIAADPPQASGAAGRALASRFRVPLIIDCLDLWPELFVSATPRALRWLVAVAVVPLRLIRRRNVRAAVVAIAVSNTYRLLLERIGAKRAITIPIGVDIGAVSSSPATRSDNRLSLIYAGSLGEHYDLDTVLDALPLDARLTIAGRGPAEERLRIRAASMPNVNFLGAVSPEDLRRLYATADAGLAPYSAGSTVALPLKLFDYLAAGLPVITSLGGAAWELLDRSGSGVRYTPGDAQSLREAIRAAGDPQRRQRMSAAARSAAAQFDAASLYAHYVNEIEALAR